MYGIITHKYFILLNENQSLKNRDVNSMYKEQLYGLKQDIIWARVMENECREKCIYDSELIDTLGNSFRIFDVIDADCVIYRLFEKACESCIISSLEFINKQDRQTIIIGNFYSISSLKFFVKNYNLRCCYMIVESNEITNSNLEQNNIPYFFKVDDSNYIIDALVPINNFETYTSLLYY